MYHFCPDNFPQEFPLLHAAMQRERELKFSKLTPEENEEWARLMEKYKLKSMTKRGLPKMYCIIINSTSYTFSEDGTSN